MKGNKAVLMKFLSTQGYKRNSPDRNRSVNVIPSGNITMKDVDFPVRGVDNFGNEIVMIPGREYTFPGDYVVETPYRKGGQTNNDREMVEGIADILTMVKDPANRKSIAKEMVRDFEREGVKYSLQNFLKMAQVKSQGMQYGGQRQPAQTLEELRQRAYMQAPAVADGTRVVPQQIMSIQQAEKLKAERNARELARRRAAIEASQTAASKPLLSKDRWTIENLAAETGATGDKFRFFPNDPDSFVDEYLNPFKMVGDMASSLGRAPLNISKGNYGQAAMSVAAPLVTGAMAGIGAKSAGQFVNNLANPLAGTGDIASRVVGKPSLLSDLRKGFKEINYIVDQSMGYLLNNRANKKAIAEGNQWLQNWINHPVTQSKIVDDMRPRINPNNIVKDKFDVALEQAKNFKPVSAEFPISKQLKTGFYPNMDNRGVSYLHLEDPYDRLFNETGRIPFSPEVGSWISRSLKMPYQKRVGTTIHEGTHDWASDFLLHVTRQKQFLENNLSPERLKDYIYWRDHGYEAAKKQFGRKRAYEAYLADPTEQHARLMELRKYLGHTPDFQSTPEYAQSVIESLQSLNKKYIPKQFDTPGFLGVIENDPVKLSNMFNRLWGVSPLVVAGAAAATEKQYGGQQGEQRIPAQMLPFVDIVSDNSGTQYPYYYNLTDEEKRFFSSNTPIGRAVRAKAQTGKVGQTYNDLSRAAKTIEQTAAKSVGAYGQDSSLENIVEVFDPSGISSWDDVYSSYEQSGMSPETYLEIFGALPLLGKVGKAGKFLQKSLRAATPMVKGTSRLARNERKAIAAGKLAAGVLQATPYAGRATDAVQAIDQAPDAPVLPFGKGGQHGGLDRWFAEKWVDIKTGKECGRQEGEKRAGYPACRPSKRVSEDTPKTASELSSAEKEKFKRSKTSSERISYQHQRKEFGGEWLEKYDDGGLTYNVKKGDTLGKIAAQNNTTVNKIVQANNIKDPNFIQINQKLVIPQSAASRSQEGPKEFVDWREKKKQIDNLNALPDEALITGFYRDKPDDTYVVVDKKNAQMKVYKGDKLVTAYEVGVGANPGDAQTVTKLTNGKVDWNAGNKSTGAGVYTISNIDPASKSYYGLPSFNLKNDRGIEVATTIHGTPVGRRSRFDNDNIEDNRMSYGCINGKCFDLKDLQKHVDVNTPVYILPEDKGNRFEIVDGKPVLRVSSENRNKYNTYIDNRGNLQKGQGANQSVNTLSYKPIQAVFDENKFKEKVFTWNDLNDEKELESTTKPFYNALVKHKQAVMKSAKIPSDVYNELAQMAFGIYGTESNFGDTHSAIGNLGRAAAKAFDSKGSSSPDYKAKATTYSADEENRSVGLTQMRWSYLNDDEKKVLNSLGIKSNMDFLNPEKAAIGTVALLAVRYNQQLTPEQKKDIWKYLPTKWNKRSNYADRVKQNSQFLTLKEQTNKRKQEGGEWLNKYENTKDNRQKIDQLLGSPATGNVDYVPVVESLAGGFSAGLAKSAIAPIVKSNLQSLQKYMEMQDSPFIKIDLPILNEVGKKVNNWLENYTD